MSCLPFLPFPASTEVFKGWWPKFGATCLGINQEEWWKRMKHMKHETFSNNPGYIVTLKCQICWWSNGCISGGQIQMWNVMTIPRDGWNLMIFNINGPSMGEEHLALPFFLGLSSRVPGWKDNKKPAMVKITIVSTGNSCWPLRNGLFLPGLLQIVSPKSTKAQTSRVPSHRRYPT